jgi:hypothetical protein
MSLQPDKNDEVRALFNGFRRAFQSDATQAAEAHVWRSRPGEERSILHEVWRMLHRRESVTKRVDDSASYDDRGGR